MCKIDIDTSKSTQNASDSAAAAAASLTSNNNDATLTKAEFNKNNSGSGRSSNRSLDQGPKVAGKNDFHWSETAEPHAARRKEILAKYPEIKQLYGPDPWLKYKITMGVVIQLSCAYLMRDPATPWWIYFGTAYVVGATCNHMMMMAFHELSHHLGFKVFWHNKLFSLFANLPVVLPAAISFKRYHLDHHKFQGEDVLDVDIPTALEGYIVSNVVTKFLFVVCQGFFYALRPLFTNPKKPGVWELANAIVCIVFDLFVYKFMGLSSLLYLLLSTFLGTGFHPVAGHFIAEHYLFDDSDNETYSYYGFFNLFTFNVGYHNEHHDFPYIPGSRLPQVRKIAAEFYDPLPEHKCWIGVMLKFILDPKVTAFSRMKRETMTWAEKQEFMDVKKQQ